jgi:hypothetical protein
MARKVPALGAGAVRRRARPGGKAFRPTVSQRRRFFPPLSVCRRQRQHHNGWGSVTYRNACGGHQMHGKGRSIRLRTTPPVPGRRRPDSATSGRSRSRHGQACGASLYRSDSKPRPPAGSRRAARPGQACLRWQGQGAPATSRPFSPSRVDAHGRRDRHRFPGEPVAGQQSHRTTPPPAFSPARVSLHHDGRFGTIGPSWTTTTSIFTSRDGGGEERSVEYLKSL